MKHGTFYFDEKLFTDFTLSFHLYVLLWSDVTKTEKVFSETTNINIELYSFEGVHVNVKLSIYA